MTFVWIKTTDGNFKFMSFLDDSTLDAYLERTKFSIADTREIPADQAAVETATAAADVNYYADMLSNALERFDVAAIYPTRTLMRVKFSHSPVRLIYDFTPVVALANFNKLDAADEVARHITLLTDEFYRYGNMASFTKIPDDDRVIPDRIIGFNKTVNIAV